LVVEKGNPNNYKQIHLDGLDIMLGFGPKIYFTQPFALKLEKFVMETYPEVLRRQLMNLMLESLMKEKKRLTISI
jgi:hypothetical protein